MTSYAANLLAEKRVAGQGSQRDQVLMEFENPTNCRDCVKTLRMPWSFETEDLDNSSGINSQVGKGAVVRLKVR